MLAKEEDSVTTLRVLNSTVPLSENLISNVRGGVYTHTSRSVAKFPYGRSTVPYHTIIPYGSFCDEEKSGWGKTDLESTLAMTFCLRKNGTGHFGGLHLQGVCSLTIRRKTSAVATITHIPSVSSLSREMLTGSVTENFTKYHTYHTRINQHRSTNISRSELFIKRTTRPICQLPLPFHHS